MKTRDPFLNVFYVFIDRIIAWLILVCVSFLVLWSAVCQNGLGYTWDQAFRVLVLIVTGEVDRPHLILFALTLTVAVLGVSLLSIKLFARWQRQSELRGEHVRGTRLED